ncbi:MAG: SCP2 sterol-binding domain-containing protein [Candidatus Sericytochromatia bacterium]
MPQLASPPVIGHDELRALCLEAGADDVGFVAIDRPELDDQRAGLLQVFGPVQTLISVVGRMNREPVRSPLRSLANGEFHHVGHDVNDVCHRIAKALEQRGVRTLNPPMAFPMEVGRMPGETPHVVSHKPIAEAAGLGKMGIHRNVIHPRFGNFVLLGTVLTEAVIERQSQPLDYNPCLSCKLCVAACPVGAIGSDGEFDFNACYTHNYREFMGGFEDWLHQVIESKDANDYGARVSTGETMSMWQSLAYGPNYKAAYCMAVCPAGDEVIAPFEADRGVFVKRILKPLQAKPETLYVIKGSDAEAHARKRFPHKTLKYVHSGLRASSVQGFLRYLPHLFQRTPARDWHSTLHFDFYGQENTQATVVITPRALKVLPGHQGTAKLSLRLDSSSWIRFLNDKVSLPRLLLTGKLRFRGDLRELERFGKCFPH